MRFPTHVARLGPLLVALLVLVSSSASFHGYLLQPSCEPAETACCSHDPASERGAPEAPEAPEDEVDCHDACCFAVSMAVATAPGPEAARLTTPAAPPPNRVAPRRAPTPLFRPPLA